MTRRGLTLTELVVVFSIISLLLIVAFPALLRVRNQAQGAVCTQNTRTLCLAWLLFKDDNDDRLVGGSAGRDPTWDNTSAPWVARPAGRGIDGEKQGITQGALFRYVGKVEVYRCPADQRLLLKKMAYRSYSIAGGANGDEWKSSYVPAQRYSQLVHPASKYVFVEEADPSQWNEWSWVMNVRAKTWADPLAVWHVRKRSSLGYADGHAEMHTWVDASTIEMSTKQWYLTPIPFGEGADVQFMANGFPQAPGETADP